MADARPARPRWRRLSVTAGILLSLALAGPVGAMPASASTAAVNAPPVSVALVPRHGAMWGAWVKPIGGQSSASAVAAFEATINRRLDIVHQYHAWDETWPTSTEYSWAAGGRIILANASARKRSGTVLTWSQIASGAQDSVIDAMAARLKAFGRQIFFTFDQEPEGRLNSTFTAASYRAASQHMYKRFVADGVRNVVWVWNVSGSTSPSDLAEFKALYPGDSYVDWVAWDPYNWNTCIHPYGWRSFDQTVAPFYNWLAAGHLSAGSAGKPYMLAEYGSVEHSGSPTKGQWFAGEGGTLPNRPRIKAVVYFNEYKDCNWPITTSSGAVAGFTSAGLTCWVNRSLPSAPTSVSATAGSGAAILKWAAAKSVCPIASYTISTSPGGKQMTVSGKVLAATMAGLASGTGYSFAIRATSVNGSSGWSGRSALVTPLAGGQASPAATPSSPPSAEPTVAPPTPVGIEPAAFRGADVLTSWLEAHVIAIPVALLTLMAFGLGAQLFASRRRRRD
jgi:hypothetical protein